MKPKIGRNFTSERGGEGVKGKVKNISLHWLQGIFETVPYLPPRDLGRSPPRPHEGRDRPEQGTWAGGSRLSYPPPPPPPRGGGGRHLDLGPYIVGSVSKSGSLKKFKIVIYFIVRSQIIVHLKIVPRRARVRQPGTS